MTKGGYAYEWTPVKTIQEYDEKSLVTKEGINDERMRNGWQVKTSVNINHIEDNSR